MSNCVWTYNKRTETWKTGCGRKIADEDTNGMWKFCPWCGGETIDQIPKEEIFDDDDD